MRRASPSAVPLFRAVRRVTDSVVVVFPCRSSAASGGGGVLAAQANEPKQPLSRPAARKHARQASEAPQPLLAASRSARGRPWLRPVPLLLLLELLLVLLNRAQRLVVPHG